MKLKNYRFPAVRLTSFHPTFFLRLLQSCLAIAGPRRSLTACLFQVLASQLGPSPHLTQNHMQPAGLELTMDARGQRGRKSCAWPACISPQLMALCLSSSESKPPAAGSGEGGGILASFAKSPHCCQLRVAELMENAVGPGPPLCVARYTLCCM